MVSLERSEPRSRSGVFSLRSFSTRARLCASVCCCYDSGGAQCRCYGVIVVVTATRVKRTAARKRARACVFTRAFLIDCSAVAVLRSSYRTLILSRSILIDRPLEWIETYDQCEGSVEKEGRKEGNSIRLVEVTTCTVILQYTGFQVSQPFEKQRQLSNTR